MANGGSGATTPVGSGGVATGVGGSGASGTPAGGTGGEGILIPVDPGRVVMHRLNVTEYDNTVRDLFETTIKLPQAMPPDDAAYGFDNVAEALSVTDTHVGYYFQTAKALSAEALTESRRARIIGCDLAAEQGACVAATLRTFLVRAWRRPPAEAEIASLVALYETNLANDSTPDEAFARVLQAVLMAPQFLYRIERNVSDGAAGPRDLDGYEVASRLSYFLWSSMPDEELFQAAQANRLATNADIDAQVTRMLAHSHAAALNNFGEQWLSLRRLAVVAPNTSVFPAFNEELRASMRNETALLFADLISGKEPLDSLLVSDFTYADDRLAAHYGLPAVGSTTPVRTPLPADSHRGGLLTHAGWLTVYSHANETAPVLRGNWILEHLLCVKVQPPPVMVPGEPPLMTGQTRRDSLESHRTDPTCAGCHRLMDPLGLGLEQYDGIGAYRTTENGLPILVDGTLPEGEVFVSPSDLQQKIAADPTFARCVARQMFIYALGRAERPLTPDANVLNGVAATFWNAGKKFPDLLRAIATSDPFRMRQDAP
jgi:hypothetical protein